MRRKIHKDKGFALKIISYHILNYIMVGSHIGVVLLSAVGSLFPGHDALMNIVGTCAEIIAGLYGITLASYTFFLSRIDSLTAGDATLEFVVESVKKRYKFLIWYITANVACLLLISVTLLYLPPVEGTPTFFYRLFCNQFILFFVYSIVLILYYSITVIAPNCLETQAGKLKKKLANPDGPDGDVFAFLVLYDQIVQYCNSLIPEAVLMPMRRNKGDRFSCTLELLKASHLVADDLWDNLLRLYRYHSCVVTCSNLCVKQELCDFAQNTLDRLLQPPEVATVEEPSEPEPNA